MNNKHRSERVWIPVLFALLVFLSYLLLWAFTGDSPFRIDAWKTGWNDEIVYWRNVRMMRKYLLPQGVIGFNDTAARHLTYGPYSFFTYLPYYLLSFLTGCESHNYIYAINVIMTAAGFLIFALLSKPNWRQAVLISLYVIGFAVSTRYNWSGMTEPSYSFFLMVITGLALNLNRREKEGRPLPVRTIVLMTGMIFLWTLMRPFYITLFLLPAWYVWRRGAAGQPKRVDAAKSSGSGERQAGTGAVRSHGGAGPSGTDGTDEAEERSKGGAGRLIGTILILLMIPATFAIYLFVRDNYMAHYFSNVNVVSSLTDLLTNGPVNMFRVLFRTNVDALKEIYVDPSAMSWKTVVTTIFFAEWVLVLILWIRKLRRREGGSGAAFLFLLLLSSLLAYEGTVVLYKPGVIHRMILAFTVSLGMTALYELGEEKTRVSTAAGAGLVALVFCLSLLSLPRNPGHFGEPQRSRKRTQAQVQESEAEVVTALENVMPHDGNDPWGNTVARPVFTKKLYRYVFSSPAYTAMSVCQDRVLIDRIENDSFHARYLMLPVGYEAGGYALYDECVARYPKLWEDGHIAVFQVADSARETGAAGETEAPEAMSGR